MIAPAHHPCPILETSLRKYNLAILTISRIIVPNHYPLTTNHYPLSTTLLHLVSYLSFSFFARDTVNDPPLAGKLLAVLAEPWHLISLFTIPYNQHPLLHLITSSSFFLSMPFPDPRSVPAGQPGWHR